MVIVFNLRSKIEHIVDSLYVETLFYFCERGQDKVPQSNQKQWQHAICYSYIVIVFIVCLDSKKKEAVLLEQTGRIKDECWVGIGTDSDQISDTYPSSINQI